MKKIVLVTDDDLPPPRIGSYRGYTFMEHGNVYSFFLGMIYYEVSASRMIALIDQYVDLKLN